MPTLQTSLSCVVSFIKEICSNNRLDDRRLATSQATALLITKASLFDIVVRTEGRALLVRISKVSG